MNIKKKMTRMVVVGGHQNHESPDVMGDPVDDLMWKPINITTGG